MARAASRSHSIMAGYHGDGISNLGTDTPMAPVTPYHYSDLPWFRFGRTPSATPAWNGDWFVVKSARAICGAHFASRTFFMIEHPQQHRHLWGNTLFQQVMYKTMRGPARSPQPLKESTITHSCASLRLRRKNPAMPSAPKRNKTLANYSYIVQHIRANKHSLAYRHAAQT